MISTAFIFGKSTLPSCCWPKSYPEGYRIRFCNTG